MENFICLSYANPNWEMQTIYFLSSPRKIPILNQVKNI